MGNAVKVGVLHLQAGSDRLVSVQQGSDSGWADAWARTASGEYGPVFRDEKLTPTPSHRRAPGATIVADA